MTIDLDGMDDADKTPEICMEAVKQYGRVLAFVPENLKTPELCLEAVKQNGYALNYVPEKLKKGVQGIIFCQEAAMLNGWALYYLPEDLKMNKAAASDLYLEAVKHHWWAIKAVPEDMRTLEICLEAAKLDETALDYAPKTLRWLIGVAAGIEDELIEIAMAADDAYEMLLGNVKEDGDALNVLPDILKTPKLCLEAVKENFEALECVPEDLKTPEICLEAVKDGGDYALQFTPADLQTPEFYAEAAGRIGIGSKQFFEEMKKDWWSKIWYSSFFKFIPAESWLEIVKYDGHALEWVPKAVKTAEFCLEVDKEGDLYLDFVPESVQTIEFWLELVKTDGMSLEYAPEKLKTPELCLEAVKQWGKDALPYVPEALRQRIAEEAGVAYDTQNLEGERT